MESFPKISWYQTPLDRTVLKNLTRKSDARALVHLLAHMGFTAGTGILVYLAFRHLSWPFTVLALFLHGTFFNFLGMFTGVHELAHKTAFRSKGLNEFFYAILGVLTWNNIHKFRASHQAHHRVTVHTGWDLEVVLPEKFRPVDWLFMFTVNPFSGAGGVPGIVSMVRETLRYAFDRFDGEWETRLFPEEGSRARRKIFDFARITLLFHVVTAVLFIATGNWILVLVVNFGCFIAPWLATLCALPQHIGLCPNTADWRSAARTMLLGPVLRFFYWNMNYHVEHHMYASVPFYNLPALHEAIKADCPEPHRGLLRTWKSLMPMIREQRRNPDACISPELPEDRESAAD